jgi:ribonuclease III
VGNLEVAVRHPLEPLLQFALSALVRFTQARYDAIHARIGYTFTNRELLRSALTHASTKNKKRRDNYERLEFLGDRVLGLVMAEKLFQLDARHREGQMSARHSSLVRGDTCAEVGRSLCIEEFIVMGPGELSKGLNRSLTVVGDVIEALIAAIYLDGGFDAARGFILRNWETFLHGKQLSDKDAKTFLQEWALARGLAIPAYAMVSREGPEHEPTFHIEVVVEEREPVRGSGKSKRMAEQAAAEAFLRRENIRP